MLLPMAVRVTVSTLYVVISVSSALCVYDELNGSQLEAVCLSSTMQQYCVCSTPFFGGKNVDPIVILDGIIVEPEETTHPIRTSDALTSPYTRPVPDTPEETTPTIRTSEALTSPHTRPVLEETTRTIKTSDTLTSPYTRPVPDTPEETTPTIRTSEALTSPYTRPVPDTPEETTPTIRASEALTSPYTRPVSDAPKETTTTIRASETLTSPLARPVPDTSEETSSTVRTSEALSSPHTSPVPVDRTTLGTATSTVLSGIRNRSITQVHHVHSTNSQTTPTPEYYSDCTQVPNSGIYILNLWEMDQLVNVYCDVETDRGGWIVVLRRQDGSTDFDLPWDDYLNGFGDLSNEFWLGLSFLREITCGRASVSYDRYRNSASSYAAYENVCEWELRVDVEGWTGNIANANYEAVFVDDDDYKLDVVGYSGNAENVLSPQVGKGFTTKNRDIDGSTLLNIAHSTHGGWWYNTESSPNLCGWYCSESDHLRYPACVNAMNWGWVSPLKKAEMKIRRIIG